MQDKVDPLSSPPLLSLQYQILTPTYYLTFEDERLAIRIRSGHLVLVRNSRLKDRAGCALHGCSKASFVKYFGTVFESVSKAKNSEAT